MQFNPQCVECKHLMENTTCKAFPKGIPNKILQNEYDHKEPYKGDNGIRFESD